MTSNQISRCWEFSQSDFWRVGMTSNQISRCWEFSQSDFHRFGVSDATVTVNYRLTEPIGNRSTGHRCTDPRCEAITLPPVSVSRVTGLNRLPPHPSIGPDRSSILTGDRISYAYIHGKITVSTTSGNGDLEGFR